MDKLTAKVRKNIFEDRAPTDGLSGAEVQKLAAGYSHFEDKRDADGYLTYSEHIITKLATPRPYIHLMASNHTRKEGVLGSFWDQTGLGFLCYDSVLAGPVTSHKDKSYVPTAPGRTDFRAFFLREKRPGKKIDIWFMNPQVRPLEKRCQLYI